MFKKPVSVETKSEKQVGGKDLKVLKRQLEERWGDQPFLGALTKQMSWRKNRTSSFLQNEDGTCVIFNSEGYDGNLPSLHTLWNFPSNLPTITIHPPVSEFVCKGADLMFPGVRKPYPEIPKGAVVQIKIAGNPNPIAIGITLEEAAHWNSLTTRSGICVQVFHHFGDHLWAKNGNVFPPGFRPGSVSAIEEVEEAPVSEPAEQNESTPASPKGGDDSNEEAKEKEDDEGDESIEAEETFGDAGTGGPSQDELLQKSFLMFMRHVKDKELPMCVNVVYQTIRKVRPPGTSIDVKKSTYKKLIIFLRAKESLGLCTLSKNGEKLTALQRSHEDYRDFQPWELAEEADEVDISTRCLRVMQVWMVPSRLQPVWDAEVVAKEQVDEGVRNFAQKHDLWTQNNRKRIGPNAVLIHEGTVAQVGEKLRGEMKTAHQVSVTFGGETKVTVRQGAPPKVQVRTMTRRGHNVTLVSGLEKYGVDLQILSNQLKQKLAASTAVEETSIMIQGLWNESVSKFLDEQWGIPLDAMKETVKKSLKEKKTKQATNIVKG